MFRVFSLFVLGVVFLSGCAGAPQLPVEPDQRFWQQQEKRVGIIISSAPTPDVYLPGASCLLCLAAAEVANSSLSKHTESLSIDDVMVIAVDVNELLQSKDIEVIEIPQELNLRRLPKHKSEAPNSTKRDFSHFAAQYNISHLLVLDFNAVGMLRTYSSYIPTSEPKGYFEALGYLVDLSDNTYEWYRPVKVLKAAANEWDESPNFPALTNAYYQAIAEGKEILISSFGTEKAIQ
ncbi:hypothetical protein [Microbulbifer sp. THAF38]|uniref:hypothetical protein n=1 Tax=Microbulbifer sp. THAF38 TaxID=2587856 RepID=UPI001268FB19|nr:hypothetical protein [Microbulbifer sp. THAF38]QFT57001.1 hypothetical protein FIU95_20850 [Microbulbifer sp. THAF38]